MLIKEIEYSLSKKIQISEYEPVGFYISAKAEVSEKEDIDKAYGELKKVVHEQMKQDFERVRPSGKREGYVDEISKIKTIIQLQKYYKKNKDKYKSKEFNQAIAEKQNEIS